MPREAVVPTGLVDGTENAVSDQHEPQQTIADVVREYFPDASDEAVDYILWSKTGAPAFWRIPLDGDTPEACLRTQLAREAERNRRGVTGCYMCGSDIPLQSQEPDCPACGGNLQRAGEILAERRNADRTRD